MCSRPPQKQNIIMDNGIDFKNLTMDELRNECLKLQSLAVAVGECSSGEVPEKVFKAWKTPVNYRQDELVWLREKYWRLLAISTKLVDEYKSGSEYSQIVDRLEILIREGNVEK